MTVLYHPDLKETVEVPDGADSTVAVYESRGWTTDVPKKYAAEQQAEATSSESKGSS